MHLASYLDCQTPSSVSRYSRSETPSRTSLPMSVAVRLTPYLPTPLTHSPFLNQVFAPIMGFSACFGGPMVNILLGIGLSGSYIISQKGRDILYAHPFQQRRRSPRSASHTSREGICHRWVSTYPFRGTTINVTRAKGTLYNQLYFCGQAHVQILSI